MRKIHLLLLFLVALHIGTTACKREDARPNATSQITRNWKAQKVENATSNTVLYEEGGVRTEDYTAYRLNFTSATNFSRTERDGTTTISGTWRFNSNQDEIIFETGKPDNVAIITLNDDTLIINYQETNAKGVSRDMRLTLVPA